MAPEPRTRYAVDLTSPEIEDILRRNPLVILPAGSVEQHGPHLPTGTDYFAAVAIGDAVAQRMDGVLLPSCPVGVTPMHMPYAGTLTLRAETFVRAMTEIVASAAAHGARRALILNWHEGNIPALALVAEALHREHGLEVVTVQACYVAEEMFGARAGGLTHGGRIEVWSVLAHRPDLVHLDRAAGASDRKRGAGMDRLRRTRAYQPVLTDIRDIAPSGWYGDPSGATVEEAEAFLAELADSIAQHAGEIFAELQTLSDARENMK
jgi:creatinine amidohydrolase